MNDKRMQLGLLVLSLVFGLVSILAFGLFATARAQNANRRQKAQGDPNSQLKTGSANENLTRGPSLTGQVIDSSGKPVTNASIGVGIYEKSDPSPGNSYFNALFTIRMSVDNSGHYSIPSLPSNRYRVCLRIGDATSCRQMRVIKLTEGKTTTLNFTVLAERDQNAEPRKQPFANRVGLLQIHITYFVGSLPGLGPSSYVPAKGVRITINGNTATTNQQGKILMRLPPGTYNLNLNENFNSRNGWTFTDYPLTVTVPPTLTTTQVDLHVSAPR